MKEFNYDQIYISKRRFFDRGNTKSYEFRIKNLINLEKNINLLEDEILEALELDLGKSNFESFVSEIGFVYGEIKEAKRNLKTWMKKKRVKTPISIQPSRSYIKREALGVCLIIGPWNYPFQLMISPLVGAIAGGNCVVLKPSNQSINTSRIIKKLIEMTFEPEYISVVMGPGEDLGPKLIEANRFDHIFFTGSVEVGRKIMKMAARNLTKVTLELGGKSPLIVLEDANLDLAAKGIVWAKFFNLGQTCVAPDYLLVEKNIEDKLIEKIKDYIVKFYGENPAKSKDYGRIINKKHFDSIIEFFYEAEIIYGGTFNREDLYIEPTLIHKVDLDSKIMSREIFGPVLPIIGFSSMEELVEIVRKNRYPLATYIYSNNNDRIEFILDNIEFGGGCINNALVHLSNVNLPFGGVGYSGLGSYHGEYSFKNFTHEKSIVKSYNNFEIPLRYPPYSKLKEKIVRKIF